MVRSRAFCCTHSLGVDILNLYGTGHACPKVTFYAKIKFHQTSKYLYCYISEFLGQKKLWATMSLKHGQSYACINECHMKYVIGLLCHTLVYKEAHLQTW